MSLMPVLLLALLPNFAPAAALDLLCEGSVHSTAKESTFSMVFHYDEQTRLGHVNTMTGPAKGRFKVTPQYYMGDVVSAKGFTYTVSLDRYSGSIVILQTPFPPEDGKADFIGECSKKHKRF